MGPALEIPPEPPLFEADFSPIDPSVRAPRPRFRRSVWRPPGGVSSTICGGASRAECQKSYSMQPEI